MKLEKLLLLVGCEDGLKKELPFAISIYKKEDEYENNKCNYK